MDATIATINPKEIPSQFGNRVQNKKKDSKKEEENGAID